MAALSLASQPSICKKATDAFNVRFAGCHCRIENIRWTSALGRSSQTPDSGKREMLRRSR